ncbi:MAG: hypothetical protein ACR2PT_03645 [Endozoicomonas sp.]
MKLTNGLIALAAISFTLQAQEPTFIEEYAVTSISILNKNGDEIREILAEELPAPARITDYNIDMEMVQIEFNGETIWLDTMDLKLDQTATVAWDCKDIDPSTQSGTSESGTVMGMSKLCN